MPRVTFYLWFISTSKHYCSYFQFFRSRTTKNVCCFVRNHCFFSSEIAFRIIIQRSLAHSLKQLTTLDYFTCEQISYVDSHVTKMLKDMAFEVSKRKCKNSVGKMFSIESALVKRNLLKWFNQKVKRQFDKINPIAKLRYQFQDPIDWKKINV